MGIGAMGSRMARRLIERGHRVVVYNRTADRARALEAAGAQVASSPREAARRAAIVIGVVTDDAASKALWLDPHRGALPAMGPETIAIESSTLTPQWVRALAEAMSTQGTAFLDAPVVGSRPQADAGQLIHLIGGDADVLRRAESVLLDIGNRIHHVGVHGSGAVLKLVVNGMFGVQVAAVVELLALAERQGLDLERTVEILQTMPTTSQAALGVMSEILAGRYEPMFPIDLVAKDFGYVLSERLGPEDLLPTAAAVRDVFVRAAHQGLGAENIHAIAKLYATS